MLTFPLLAGIPVALQELSCSTEGGRREPKQRPVLSGTQWRCACSECCALLTRFSTSVFLHSCCSLFLCPQDQLEAPKFGVGSLI